MLYFFNIGTNISISPAGKIPVSMVVGVDYQIPGVDEGFSKR